MSQTWSTPLGPPPLDDLCWQQGLELRLLDAGQSLRNPPPPHMRARTHTRTHAHTRTRAHTHTAAGPTSVAHTAGHLSRRCAPNLTKHPSLILVFLGVNFSFFCVTSPPPPPIQSYREYFVHIYQRFQTCLSGSSGYKPVLVIAAV